MEIGDATESISDHADLKKLLPNIYGKPSVRFTISDNPTPHASPSLNVGIVLSGGQAPGGHNVIAGLLDSLKKYNPRSSLLGFLGGASGILQNNAINITSEIVAEYRNTGGFDMIGSGREKIESKEQFDLTIQTCRNRKLDAIVIIGGDDSNTNAALLAEYLLEKNQPTVVIGVPKTIDGDLKGKQIETSFGFDTATKVYSGQIGNICRDAKSSRKYWHFIRVMGRSASHIALECALQIQPNICIISEEIRKKELSLYDLVTQIADTVCFRAKNGENFGIAIIPEGLIEFIPEVGVLINELNDLLSVSSSYFETLRTFEAQEEFVNQKLSKDSSYVFSSLPNEIQRQLLMDRDPHGNVQVSRIETEKLLMEMVANKLRERSSTGDYQGKFNPIQHFFGYEGRCAFPSNFDSDYCYSLGCCTHLLIEQQLTGYLAVIGNLSAPVNQWTAGGVPLTALMNIEKRHNKLKPVIRKALVDLNGQPFRCWEEIRKSCSINTQYLYPGTIQYYGPKEICDRPTQTLTLEQNHKR